MKNIFTHHKQPNYPYYDIPNAKCNIVIGSAGMGNTSGYTKPVLYNAKPGISYIATGFFDDRNFKSSADNCSHKVKYFNFSGRNNSFHYNPLRYIKNAQDAMELAQIMSDSVSLTSKKEFSVIKHLKNELLAALILYVCEEYKDNWSMRNLAELDSLLHSSFICQSGFDEINVNSEAGKLYSHVKEICSSDFLDKLFYELNVDIMCLKLIDKYDILNDDNSFTDIIDFEDIYKEDTIIFINEYIDDISSSYSYTFIASAFVNQAMNAYRKKQESGNKVRFVLDEFQSLYIPDLNDKIEVVTKNNCEVDIISQSFYQIADAPKIIDLCDNIICMGTIDCNAAKLIYALSNINVFKLSATECIVIEKDNNITHDNIMKIVSYNKKKEMDFLKNTAVSYLIVILLYFLFALLIQKRSIFFLLLFIIFHISHGSTDVCMSQYALRVH